MGACGSFSVSKKDQASGEENVLNTKINTNAAEEHKKTSGTIKILFLGAGESGKSTIFKQMIKLYGKGFSLSELRDFTSTINHNIATSVFYLLEHAAAFKEEALPAFFDATKTASTYNFASSEALDWLVSGLNDAAKLLEVEMPELDVEMSRTLSDYAENDADTASSKDDFDKDGVHKSLSKICDFLGEPKLVCFLSMAVLFYLVNFLDKEGLPEDGQAKTKAFITNFNFEELFCEELLAELKLCKEKIIDNYTAESLPPKIIIKRSEKGSEGLKEEEIDLEHERNFFDKLVEEKNNLDISTVTKMLQIWENNRVRSAFAYRGTATNVQDNLRYYLARLGCLSFMKTVTDLVKTESSGDLAKILAQKRKNSSFSAVNLMKNLSIADKESEKNLDWVLNTSFTECLRKITSILVSSPKNIDSESILPFVPSLSDAIRSRARTSGLQMREVVMQENKFQLIDVGGQRSERRKWLHAFDNVTAVIFVASISGYDSVLFEDETTNRITEALTLFEQICKMRFFKDQAFILFLNKVDIFRQKVERTPIEANFEEFKEFKEKAAVEGMEELFTNGKEFFKAKFMEKSNGRDVYVHFTTATDTSNIIKIFNAVKASIINSSLKHGGLV